MASGLDLTHPAISDLRRAARRRLPKFAFEYLDSATGSERGSVHNRERLDAVRFMPGVLQGDMTADLGCRLLGHDFALPFGIAPVGMSGMIWAGAERKLAKAAARHAVPYCLSTVAAATPEEIGPHAGDMGWFQLYAPADPEIRRDMLRRAGEAGFKALILTVDVPGESRRERQRRSYVAMPPKLTLPIVFEMLRHPVWSLAMAREGAPRMKFPESYVTDEQRKADPFLHAGRIIRGWPDWAYLEALRSEWDGPLIVKGVLDPAIARQAVERGVDAIWISNHATRQFEAPPAAIDQIAPIRATVGPDVPLLFDSGVEGGLDILRGLAHGADMVFLGKAFHFAIAALGEDGIEHLFHILEADLRANMAQLGVERFADLPSSLIDPPLRSA